MTARKSFETICRFCLYSGYQNWHQIVENNEVMKRIHSCLKIQVSTNILLPNQICQVCFDKIEEIYKFHLSITDNEKRLLEFLNSTDSDENLLNFEACLNHERFQNDQQNVKEIDTDSSIFLNFDSSNIKKEESSLEYDFDHNFCSDDDIPLLKTVKNESSLIKEENKNSKVLTESLPEKEFKCLMCFQICESVDVLFQHYTEHTDKNYLKSTKALYTFKKSEDGSKIFECGKCDKNLYSKRCMDRHWILMHVNCRPFVCKLCSRTYKTAADIMRHARVHKEGCKLLCSFSCGYSTVYRGAMNDHEKRHKNDFKYICGECGRGFNVQTSYSQHLNIHKGIKPFVCDLCGIAFTMDKYLYQHKVKVHEISSSTKRYICVHCSLPFDSKHVLNQHLKDHGKIVTFHLCDICGKDFPTSSKLKIHKNSHLGIRPYSCSLCSKSFAKKCNLKLHEVTHTGAKNFTCSNCGKHYTQKSALQRHITKHHSGLAQAASTSS